MKSDGLIWLMAGVFLLLMCIPVVPVSAADPPGTGIYVSSTPPGAKILTEGSDAGVYTDSGNLTDNYVVLTADTYHVKVTLDGYSDQIQYPVTVTDGSYTHLDFTLVPQSPSGSITVTSNPTGAFIYIDDIIQSDPTPYTYSGLTPGTHKVQVAQNYVSQTTWVTVNDGLDTPLFVDLTGDPTFTSITPSTGPTAGGIAVTIIGSHFVDGWNGGGPLTVTIGGTQATVTSPTDGTFIYATTPSGATGPQDVVITNGGYGGQSVTATGAYTYMDTSGPVHNTNTGINYATIQEAIDAASPGNTITVDSGTYIPFIVNKQLTILGIDTGSGLPVVETLGYSYGNTIEFTPEADGVTLDGFTVNSVTYGSGPTGRGVYINPGSSSNVLRNIAVKDFSDGIYIDGTNNNRIETCTGSGNRIGINIDGDSTYNTVDQCQLTNGYYTSSGVEIGNSENSNNNTIRNSIISGMSYGIVVGNQLSGTTTQNYIEKNTVFYNDQGILLWGPDNTIDGNTITSNSIYGLHIYPSSANNLIYDNFFSQDSNVNVGTDNIWNTAITSGENVVHGHNLGGNYWANPSGTDFSQVCPDTDSDGICDSAYTIYSPNNIDNYPLTASPVSFAVFTTPGGANISMDSVDTGFLTPHTFDNKFVYGSSHTVIVARGGYWSQSSTVLMEGEGTSVYFTLEPGGDFTAAPVSPEDPLTIQFTEAITGSLPPTSRTWSFGDGATSTEKDPVYTYATPGTYDVNLTVYNTFGDSAEIKKEITVGELPPGGTPVTTCTVITTPGTYILQNDIVDSTFTKCIDIRTSDVIFDGNGHTVDGVDASNTDGIYISNDPVTLRNLTVKNAVLTDWGPNNAGIKAYKVENCTISNNKISSGGNGVSIGNTPNATISRNNVSENSGMGIVGDSSNGITIDDNTLLSNSGMQGAIQIENSSWTRISNNSIRNSKYGIYLNSYYNNLNNNDVFNNTITDILYTGIWFLSENSLNKITNNRVIGAGGNAGIHVNYGKSDTISNNVVSTSSRGFSLVYVNNTTVNQNNATSNTGGNFLVDSSWNNNFINNSVWGSNNDGFYLNNASYNSFEGNHITGNGLAGIRFSQFTPLSVSNEFFDNYCNNYYNVMWESGNVATNTWNTTKSAGTTIIGGSSLGGNYWAQPNGQGFSQINPDTDGDGISNAEYALAAGNIDMLPLTNNFSAPSPPVANFTTNVTSGTVPLAVAFTDTSTGSPISWNWSFGDGNFSELHNPVHSYYSPGMYSVGLNVSNADGFNDTIKTDFISVTNENALVFDILDKFPKNSQGENGIYLQYLENGVYYDLSNIADYQFAIFTGTWWIPQIANANKIGEGYPGYPPHGINAHPTAINQVGLEADTIIRITIPGPGGIIWVNGSAGEEMGNVRFYIFKGEENYNNPLWSSWDTGVFNVSVPYSSGDQLFFATDAGSDDVNDWAYWSTIQLVNSNEVPPVASFIANITEGTAPLAVAFTDMSMNTPTSWNWSFRNVTGNNTEVWWDTAQNPEQTFGVGNYSIALNASNSAGSNVSTQVTFVNVSASAFIPGWDGTTCTVITTPGTYQLQGDIQGTPGITCIDIRSSDVLLEGNDHILNGTAGGLGVGASASPAKISNVTVRNLTISNWGRGIAYENVTGGTIDNTTALFSLDEGVSLLMSSSVGLTNVNSSLNRVGVAVIEGSDDNTLTRVSASRNDAVGVWLYAARDNTVMSGTFDQNNGTGLALNARSNDNTLSGNTANFNSHGIVIRANSDGFISEYPYGPSDNNTIEDNIARNNTEVGIVLFESANNNHITGNTVVNNSLGIYCNATLGAISGNNIDNNNASFNSYNGISFSNASANILTANTVTSNGNNGILLFNKSRGNFLSDNIAALNGIDGFVVSHSRYNNLTHNNAMNNVHIGINLDTAAENTTVFDNSVSENDHGILLYFASNNTIINNSVSANNEGFRILIDGNNTITNNTVTVNNLGIWVNSSHNAFFNNYFSNTNNAVDGSTSGNYWNTTKTPGISIIGGPYLGGNYWAQPDGQGFSQINPDTDGDGISNADYTLASGSIDHLPLTNYIAQPAPVVTSAATNPAGTAIYITFNKAMADPTGKHDEFKYQINGGSDQPFNAAGLSGIDMIGLVTSGTAIAPGDSITVSYTAGTVIAADTGVLATFSNQPVTNLKSIPPTVTSAATNPEGTAIYITFNKAMADPTGKHDEFKYQINGGSDQPFNAAGLSGIDMIGLVTSGTAIAPGDTVTVSYTAGTVIAADTGVLATFSNQPVTNSMITPAPTVTSVTPNSGVNSSPVSITNLAGTGFVNGATVKLNKTGQSDIPATGVVWDSATQLHCIFPITGAATGSWNVVVTNPDAQSGTLINGFMVTGLAPAVPGTIINQTATVFIGEAGLDITPALAQANEQTGTTGLTTIGWWASPAEVTISPPTQTNETAGIADSYTVDPGLFVGYTGVWYLVKADGTGGAPVFNIQDPALSLNIWDFDQNAEVTGYSVTYGEQLGFRINTNMYPAVNMTQRSPLNPETDGYIDIKVRDPNGAEYTTLLNDSVGTPTAGPNSLLANFVDAPTWYWGGLYSIAWQTGALDSGGSPYYPSGTYSVSAESTLHGMKDNYKNGGADYTTKTISQTVTVTLVPNTVKIETNKDSLVRGESFSVTVTGRGTTTYHLWVANTSDLTGGPDGQPPLVSFGQSGVKLDPNQGSSEAQRAFAVATPGSALGYAYANGEGRVVFDDVAHSADTGYGTWTGFNIVTSVSGNRTVEFVTTSLTKAQKYTIHVEQNFGSDANPSFKIDEVDVNVEAAPTGNIRVESVPDGADVSIDGLLMASKTNDTFISVPVGVHTVNVTHAGYFDARRQVTVESGATNTTVITMDAIPSALAQPVINAVQVVLDEKLNGDSTGTTVSAYPSQVSAPTVNVWSGRDPLQFDTTTCSLVLIDPTPNANWEHPVTYVCVDETGKITETKDAYSPATNYEFTYAAGEPESPGEYWVPNDPKAWQPPTCTENCANYYAVLIDGGTDMDHNYIRYWNDIAFMYITLIEYGYTPSHITVLMSDGSSTANDRKIANSGTMYDSSPQDLNGDKVAETILPATKAQVQATLMNLKNTLKTTDNLFIFTTGHGSGDSSGSSKLLLWNSGYITDAEFYTALFPNNAKSVTMMMEQCYSGGFNDNFLSGADSTHSRVLITATNVNEPSYGNGFSNAWTIGVAGHTRYNPTTFDRTADTNGDQRVTMTEGYTYANAKDPYAVSATEHPQKYSSPSTAIASQYLNDCSGTATKSITVTYPTLPGYSWQQGSFHELTWDEKGISGNVNIILVQGTTELSTIATVPAIPGSYFWTIPAAQAIATNYKIRVKATDGTSGTSGNTFSIIAKPATNTGSLVISTSPTGASVYLDGSATASGKTTTPLTLSNLVQGDHRVKVSLSGYYDQSFKVTVTAQQTNTLSTWALDKVPTDANGVAEDYSPFGGLDVRSDPDEASMWIAQTGQTPVDKGVSPAVLQLEPGDYQVYLTKDGFQQSAVQTVTVEKLYPDRAPVVVDFTLTPSPNVAPVVNALSNAAITPGSTFTQIGSFTDPNTDDSWTATVNYGDGSGSQSLSLTGKTFSLSHVYANKGVFTVTVVVTDKTGATGSGTATVTVTETNVAPVVNAGPDAAITKRSTFSQTGSFTDPDSSSWTATVNFGDGSGSQQLALKADKTFSLSHKYVNNGVYTVTVTVKDNAGGTGTDTVTVTVGIANAAPVVNAGPDAAITKGGTFSQTGSFTDPDSSSWTSTVNFGDGSGSQQLALKADKTFSLSHKYVNTGQFTVKVSVMDDKSGVGSDTAIVTVTEANVVAQVLIVPQPLNIGRTGYFLAFVKLPTGYNAADVDAGSVYCENKQALKLVRINVFPQIFAAVFSRQDLAVSPGNIKMTVRGTIRKNGATVPFSGSTNVNVINKKITIKEDVDSVMTMPDTQIFTKFNKF